MKDCKDKRSAHYFMCHMTQEEWDQMRVGHRADKDYKFNHIRHERSKRENSNYDSIDEWLKSPESKEGRVEIGSTHSVRFITSKGIKKIEPGKNYDINLNEI